MSRGEREGIAELYGEMKRIVEKEMQTYCFQLLISSDDAYIIYGMLKSNGGRTFVATEEIWERAKEFVMRLNIVGLTSLPSLAL